MRLFKKLIKLFFYWLYAKKAPLKENLTITTDLIYNYSKPRKKRNRRANRNKPSQKIKSKKVLTINKYAKQ